MPRPLSLHITSMMGMIIGKACVAFPGLDGVEVCVIGDTSTGDPVAIEYKIPGLNDGECSACDKGRPAGGLSGNAKHLLESIGAFLHGKGTPDASTLSKPSLAKYLSTIFTRKVIEALLQTKAGETTTYAELASKAGSPGAARAVGNVMRRNPFPIVIPCHRVVSRNGLGGYSGDVRGTSLRIKQALLEIEAARK